MKNRYLWVVGALLALPAPASAWQGYKDYVDKDKNWAATAFDMPGFMPQRIGGSPGFDADFSVVGSVLLNVGASALDAKIPFAGTILSTLIQSGMENSQQQQIVRQQPRRYAERRPPVRHARHHRRIEQDRSARTREIIAELEKQYVLVPRFERRETVQPKADAVPAPKTTPAPKAEVAPAPKAEPTPLPKGSTRFEYDDLPSLSRHPHIHDARFPTVATMLDMQRPRMAPEASANIRRFAMFAESGRSLLNSRRHVRQEYAQPLQINTRDIHKALLR